MLVLDSDDARADVAAFRAAGLQAYDPFDFSRKARLPNGQEATVGFSLAFVTHPAMPDVAFVVFSGHNHPPLVRAALAAGASRYVVKSEGLDALLRAIRESAGGTAAK